jgi:dolichol-phosphate mannosyltransferase
VTVPRQERRLPAWVTGLIRIALTVVVTWFILDRIGLGLEDFRELDAGEWRPSWGWLAAATALLLVTNLLAAVLWGLMVRDLGGPRVTPGASVRVYFLSNLGRYIPGKVWQIAGMAYLGRAEGVPPATATAAAILCQAFTLAGAALFGTGALIAGQGRLRDAGIVALGVIVLGLGAAMIPAVHRRLVGLWKRTGGQAVPGEPRIGVTFPARWTGAYLVVWMVQGVAFWLLALSFGQAGSLWTLGPAYAAASRRDRGPRVVPDRVPAARGGPRCRRRARGHRAALEHRRGSGAGGNRRRCPDHSQQDPAVSDVKEDATGRVLVIIPTYDEIENLPRVVPLALEQDPAIHVLVVDDNSPDGTGELAESMARENPRVHVLRREAKDGLGRAYIAGFRWGLERGYDLLIEMDADLSHPVDHLPHLIEAAESYDVVVGSRYVDGRVTVVNWPISRLMLSLFGSAYARAITRLPVRDTTGGFNCWRRKVLETIRLDRVQSNGYAFQIELKLRAWRRGFTITEVPIVFTERDTGESKMSKKIVREAVWRVWKLRFLDLFGRL